jgi:competence protein ComEC
MREELEGRPLLGLALALILGLALPQSWVMAPLVAGLAWVYRGRTVRIVLGCSLLLGLLISPRPVASFTEPAMLDLQATVCSAPKLYPDWTTFEACSADLRLAVGVPGQPFFAYGDRLHLTGLVRPLNDRNARLMRLEGIHGRMSAPAIERLRAGPAPFVWAEKWRRSFVQFSNRWLPAREAAAIQALTFNLPSMLDDEVRDELRRTGTMHIVSASGLHVMILAVGLMFALTRLPVPRGWQLLAAAGVLAFYAMATGMNPPVVRAVVMALVGWAAYLWGREPDLLSALGLAAAGYLLVEPEAVLRPGFQLSFLIVASFAIVLKPMRDDLPSVWAYGWHLVREWVRVSFVASMVSAPIVAYHFGMVSLTSIPANLLVAPVLTVVLLAALSAHLLAFLLPVLGVGLLATVVGPLVGWIYLVLDLLGSPSWAATATPVFPALLLLPLYIGLLLLWRPRVRMA